jgi:hypothetical protein
LKKSRTDFFNNVLANLAEPEPEFHREEAGQEPFGVFLPVFVVTLDHLNG